MSVGAALLRRLAQLLAKLAGLDVGARFACRFFALLPTFLLGLGLLSLLRFPLTFCVGVFVSRHESLHLADKAEADGPSQLGQ